MSSNKGVTILGGSNQDDFYYISRFPNDHETLIANEFKQFLGGKAIMVAKLSHASTANIFVGCVGVDLPASAIKQNYKNHNFVNVDKHVRTIDNMSSGIANVMVDQSTGHNRIILVTGANGMFSAEHVQDSWSDIVYVEQNALHCSSANTNTVLCQLETPVSVALQAFSNAKQDKLTTILNTAPASNDLPAQLFQLTDILVANEEEASVLTGITVTSKNDAPAAAEKLSQMGCKFVVITLGAQGYVIRHDNGTIETQDAFKVANVVDTTGAGDCFCGTMAYFVSQGVSLSKACQYANYTSSLSVQKKGAQPSYPDKSCLDKFEAK